MTDEPRKYELTPEQLQGLSELYEMLADVIIKAFSLRGELREYMKKWRDNND
jgi:hypothetical protein